MKKMIVRLIGVATCVAVMSMGLSADAGWRGRGSHGSSGGSYSSHGSSGGSYSSHGSSGGSYSRRHRGSHGSHGSYGSHGSHGSHGSWGY